MRNTTVKSLSICKNTPKTDKREKLSVDITIDGSLKVRYLLAGANVSVDHFKSRIKGWTYDSFGKTSSDQYVGGCIFVDHMSSDIHVEPQLWLSTSESIHAFIIFEKLCLDNGTLIQSSLQTMDHLKQRTLLTIYEIKNRRIQYYVINAHYQNGIAERNIRTVSGMFRALILHAFLQLKNGIDRSFWPMVVEYATYIFNHLPSHNGHVPVDLFTKSHLPRHRILDIHTWGGPIYVLDPTLQAGKKLPCWQPQYRRGHFVGFSNVQFSDISLVLNNWSSHSY